MNQHYRPATRLTALAAAMFGAGAISLAASPDAAAQPTESGAASAGRLDEVVVTARRREESLQQVPIAVSAFDGEQLSRAGMNDLSSLTGRVPSFTYQEAQSNKQDLFLRGIGTSRLDAAVVDPSIGMFQDEVYIGRRGTAQPPLFDLARVEVLRGPQGTLWGRNVVGGGIGMVTARPEFDRSGGIQVRAGVSDGHFRSAIYGAEGFVTGGITDRIAGRAAVYMNSHGGYSRNVRPDPTPTSSGNQRLANQDMLALRGSLLFDITEDIEFNLVADFSRDSSDGACRHAIQNPNTGPGPVASSGMLPDNVRDCDTPYRQFTDRDTAGLTGRLEWNFDQLSLTWLSGLRHGDSVDFMSQTGTSSPPSFTDSLVSMDENYRGLTQELRVSSDYDTRFNYTAGLYYLRERTNSSHTNLATSFANTGPGSLGDILDGEWEYTQRGVSYNQAVFAEVYFDLSDTVQLTLGGRYTRDRKTFYNAAECLDFGPPGSILCVAPLGVAEDQFSIRVDNTWNEFTPKVALDWQVTDASLLYASATRGFKGGGWQSKPQNEVAARAGYDPETAWNYELGAKSDLLDGRLRLNVAAFYTDFSDLQVEVLDDVLLVLVVDNAAEATIRGLEVEANWFATEYLSLWLSGSLLDTEYEDFGDNTGNTLQFTSEEMVSAGFDWEFPLANGAVIDWRMEYRWQGTKYWNPENTLSESPIGLVDGRLAYRPDHGSWEVALWGRNLTDTTYRVGVIPFLGDVFSRYAAPRSFGVQFNASF